MHFQEIISLGGPCGGVNAANNCVEIRNSDGETEKIIVKVSGSMVSPILPHWIDDMLYRCCHA